MAFISSSFTPIFARPFNQSNTISNKSAHSSSPPRRSHLIICQRNLPALDDEAFVTCPNCGSDHPISASEILKKGSLKTKCYECRNVWNPQAKDALTLNGSPLTVNTTGEEGSDDSSIANLVGQKLFISGLGPKVDSTKLRKEFEVFGEVVDAKVIYDKVTGRSRGFGFVTVVGKSAASAAIDSLTGDKSSGLGMRVKVKEADE